MNNTFKKNLLLFVQIICVFSLFLGINNVDALSFNTGSEKLWGGGNISPLTNSSSITWSCSAESGSKELITISNSNGCSISAGNIFSSAQVKVKLTRKYSGGASESVIKPIELVPNAVKASIKVGETYDAGSSFKNLGLKSYKSCINDFSVNNASVLEIGECGTYKFEATGKSPGISTLELISFSGIKFRSVITVADKNDTSSGSNSSSESGGTNSSSSNQFSGNNNQTNTTSSNQNCEGLLGPYLKKDLENILKIIRIVAPLLVVILTTFELVGAVASKDDDALKKGMSKLKTRIIIVIALFFLPVILNLLLGFIDTKYSTCIN